MAPILDAANPPTDYTKDLALAFKLETTVDVVPTFVPAAQVNAEIEFEVRHTGRVYYTMCTCPGQKASLKVYLPGSGVYQPWAEQCAYPGG